MPDSNDPPRTLTAPRLLRGAALLFAVLGGAFLVWVGNQWVEYPEMRASQFGFQAPLWPALGAFVLGAVGAVVALFWTAAGRVEAGEDLFAQRHRRRAADPAESEPNEQAAK